MFYTQTSQNPFIHLCLGISLLFLSYIYCFDSYIVRLYKFLGYLCALMNSEPCSSLKESFLLLKQKGVDVSLSIKEIAYILFHERHYLIILILVFPFCIPIQIPGLSTPFGLAIAFIGFRISFSKNLWVPDFLLKISIPSHVIKQIADNFLWLLKKSERFIHSRISWLCDYPGAKFINGLLIAILGLLLALPLPIPFSNIISSWPILILTIGLLENDGLLVGMGYVLSFLAFIFFTALFLFFTTNLFA